MSLVEVTSFHRHFDECQDRAYNWELWAAAYIIGGGCSDDAFSDFRSTLISMGRHVFEAALADPEFLATIDYDPDVAMYEGYQYVPTSVEERLANGQTVARYQAHPMRPSGEQWDEGELEARYPKLATKYAFAG